MDNVLNLNYNRKHIQKGMSKKYITNISHSKS